MLFPLQELVEEDEEIQNDYTATEFYQYQNDYGQYDENYEHFSSGEVNTNYAESSRASNIEIIHNGKQYQCDFCEKSFTLQSNLKRHTEQIHQKKKHECLHCHKTYGRSDILREHIKCVHGTEKSYKCDYLDCEKLFQSRPAKKAHMDTVHKKLPKKVSKPKVPKQNQGGHQIQCPKCFKIIRSGNIITHNKRFHADSKYPCEFCENSFSKISALQEHLRTDHEGLESKILELEQKQPEKHICELCGKNFTRNRGLLEHVANVHHGRKDFKCQFCQKEFALKNNMVAHVKMVHQRKRENVCPQCGNTFASLSSLKKHAKCVHEGTTQTCTICGKEFSINASMKEHIDTVHKGLTNHTCEICGKRFGRQSHLGRHKRKIHGIYVRKIILPDLAKPEVGDEFIEPID